MFEVTRKLGRRALFLNALIFLCGGVISSGIKSTRHFESYALSIFFKNRQPSILINIRSEYQCREVDPTTEFTWKSRVQL